MLMTKGEAYVDQGQDYYEQQHQQRVMKTLKKKALALGFSLTPIDAAVACNIRLKSCI
jgi:transposase